MGKSTWTERLKKKMHTDIKHSGQTTLNDLQEEPKSEAHKPVGPQLRKDIEIIELTSSASEDELVVRVWFRLRPSRTAFSKVTSDLYFDGQETDHLVLHVLQGPLAADESEFTFVLDMTGIGNGQHILKVEMYELWSSGEKLADTSKELAVEYSPMRREDRLVRVPIVKRVATVDLAVISDSEKRLYRKIEETMKKDTLSKRDEW